MLTSKEFSQNFKLNRLKFYDLYDISNKNSIYFNYLYLLYKSKRNLSPFVIKKYMDEIISIFTTRTSYPILCEDTRDLIITEVFK